MAKKIIITSVLGLLVGVFATLVYIRISSVNDLHVDVTFMNERQAVVFWQSKKPGMGYLKFGPHFLWRPTRVDQTSSEADVIHTVLLEELPLEGVYISLHTTKQPLFTLPRVTHIQFTPEETNEN